MERVKDQVVEGNEAVGHIPASEAVTLHGQRGVTLVDLRDICESEREGGVPDSLHSRRGMLEFGIDPGSPCAKQEVQSGNRFAFVCASGLRSALAATGMGPASVAHIDDCLRGWREACGPVEEG